MPDVFGLYLVLTDPLTGYETCAEAAVETGVRYLQLRMKKRPREEVLDMARRLRHITAGSGTRFIVNDEVEIAAEVDADGVHLGQDDMSVTEARKRWPQPGKIFGLSTHNEDQERLARDVAPDYIGVGPVFATPTKERPDPTLGPERMGRIVGGSPLTTVAIGGIDADRLPEVLRHGAVNYCVLRAVNLSPDPKSAILRLQEIWREHRVAR
jgi:thiamine-phosphate pyrophosphorylase